VLFYDQVFKTSAKGGNCFGVALLNLMIQKNGGYLGYCAPVTQYSGGTTSPGSGPTDQMLRRAINVMHAHQVNLPTVQFVLNIFAQHMERDGAYAFDQFNYWQSRGDLTVVNIYPGVFPDSGGHTLFAYRAADLGGGNKKIFVLDPDRTWGNSNDQDWYNRESNFIQITNHAWSFDKGGSTWSGDLGSGGSIFIIPVSVTGPLSRSPASLGDTVIGKILNEIFLTGDSARIEQVTDAQGKRLYKPGTLEIDSDPVTGMTNMVPWFPAEQRRSNRQIGAVTMFHFGSSGGALRFSVSAGTGGYTLSSMSGRTIVSVTAHGGTGTDALTIRNPGTATTSVSLENHRGASDYDVAITRVRVPRTQIRVLSASALRINGEGPTGVGLANNGEALQISSPQASLRYNLTLSQVTRSGREALTRSEVSQDPGAARVVQPQNWQQLKGAQVVEQWRALVPP
jgi:hypothetical protein